MTIRALIVGSDAFPFHRISEAGPPLAAAVGATAEVETTTDRDALVAPDRDVVVDYLTDSTLTDEQLGGLLSFVRAGGGYVGVHCAADLTSVAADDPDAVIESRDEPIPELRALLGGHFVDHPEQTTFGVRIADDHPVTDGVTDFRVFDEPYQVAWDDDVRVLARMEHPGLDAYPVAWTRSHGEGRVAYCSLGHTEEALTHPAFHRLIANAVRWAART